MARIEHEAMRMGHLVEDLLLLARLDRGRPLESEPVDLGTLVVDAVVGAGAVEPERPIRVELGGEAAQVQGDPNRLRQVLDNLLANVREHTPPGTPASVRLAATDARVALVVADEGPGMTAHDASHVFERFWQSGADAASAGRGTGLGLSIVAEIVAAHHGEIHLDTAPGRGRRSRSGFLPSSTSPEASRHWPRPVAHCRHREARPPSRPPASTSIRAGMTTEVPHDDRGLPPSIT